MITLVFLQVILLLVAIIQLILILAKNFAEGNYTSGYANKVNDVGPGDIGEVIGVASSNVSLVIGV